MFDQFLLNLVELSLRMATILVFFFKHLFVHGSQFTDDIFNTRFALRIKSCKHDFRYSVLQVCLITQFQMLHVRLLLTIPKETCLSEDIYFPYLIVLDSSFCFSNHNSTTIDVLANQMLDFYSSSFTLLPLMTSRVFLLHDASYYPFLNLNTDLNRSNYLKKQI